MINERMYGLGVEPNKIRELFAYGAARKATVGEDKVFDFSIGNPSVPAPLEVKDAILAELDQEKGARVHEYTQAAGDGPVLAKIAGHISDVFKIQASPGRVYMTSGASSALAITLSAISQAGDSVVVPSPYFPEYKTWVDTAGASLVAVPCSEPSFQLDVEAMDRAIVQNTAAVIINSPCNPTGAVYTEETLRALCDILEQKQKAFGHPIYIISDEAYREIVYPGVSVPSIPAMYDNTIICYTYSKSLSLPGERIGYIYVNDTAQDSGKVYSAVCGSGRALGYICASVLMQRVVAACTGVPAPVDEYAENREILTSGLRDLGYEFSNPDGAFYLWVRSLEPDAEAFSERAKQFELLVVPSDSFGVGGWVRISYCVSKDMIVLAMPAFKALKESYE